VAELESAAAAELEEVRREGAGFVQLLASHVGAAASAADAAARRAAALEREQGALGFSVLGSRG
jgi:hypothetical protein